MQTIEINVKGETGSGKSHVLAVIERALIAEYGPLMKINCSELVSERNLIGGNLDSWNKPNPTQVNFNLTETNVPIDAVAQDDGLIHLEPTPQTGLRFLVSDCTDGVFWPAVASSFETAVGAITWVKPSGPEGAFTLDVQFTPDLVVHIEKMLDGLNEALFTEHGLTLPAPYFKLLLLDMADGKVKEAWMFDVKGWKHYNVETTGQRLTSILGSVENSPLIDAFADSCLRRQFDRPFHRGYSEQIEQLKEEIKGE